MVYNLIEIFNIIPEVLLIPFFYSHIFQRKYVSYTPYFCFYIFSFLIMSFTAIFIAQPSIQITLTFIILFTSANVLYTEKILTKFFASLYYILLIFISESLFIGILMFMDYGNPTELLQSGIGRILGMTGTKILDFWLIVYSYRIYKNKVKSLPLNFWIQILLMPFLSIVLINLIFNPYETNTKSMGYYLFCIICLLYLNIFVFNSFDSFEKRIKLTALEQIIEHETENYKIIETSYNEIRTLKHDFKNQANVIYDLIKNKEYSSAQQHIQQLYNISEKPTFCYTGNPAIDSIINLKGVRAKNKDIKYITKVHIETLYWDTFKLCRILGNALDNAIEACERTNNTDKYVYLNITQTFNNLIIEISNSSPKVDINNLTTSKENKHVHGLGIQSIKQAVKDMNGYLSFNYNDNCFTLKIYFIK